MVWQPCHAPTPGVWQSCHAPMPATDLKRLGRQPHENDENTLTCGLVLVKPNGNFVFELF